MLTPHAEYSANMFRKAVEDKDPIAEGSLVEGVVPIPSFLTCSVVVEAAPGLIQVQWKASLAALSNQGLCFLSPTPDRPITRRRPVSGVSARVFFSLADRG